MGVCWPPQPHNPRLNVKVFNPQADYLQTQHGGLMNGTVGFKGVAEVVD